MKDPKKERDEMHGEGNPEADRQYREALQKFVGTKESRKKAREAAESVAKEERKNRGRV
jgi:hypothetical protein